MFAEGLAVAGEVSAGRAAIDEALTRSDRNGERWFDPELLRIKGELVLLENRVDAALAAEDLFRQAIDLAHQQGALSWELRVAISLARMLHDRGQNNPARQALAPVYARFAEGSDTADLQIAKNLLKQS